MRALFLQHHPGSEPALVGAALERRGFRIELPEMATSIIDGTWRGAFPDVRDFDLVVPLGAVFSLNDRTQVGTWIDRELELLREADRRAIPVLGICFGAQALAAAHGGRVTSLQRPQIGWSEVDSDRPDLIPTGPWMQWHSDRVEIPPDATELARDQVCPQAFTLRRNLAVQFHPEVTEVEIGHWLALAGADGGHALTDDAPDPEQLLADTRANADRAARDVDRLVEGFLTEIAERPVTRSRTG